MSNEVRLVSFFGGDWIVSKMQKWFVEQHFGSREPQAENSKFCYEILAKICALQLMVVKF